MDETLEIIIEIASLDSADKIWATLIAIAYLRKNHASENSEWELIARKALRWLRSQNQDPDTLLTLTVNKI